MSPQREDPVSPELEAIAQKYWDKDADEHAYTSWGAMLTAVKEAHELGAKAGAWIATKDRMPDMGTRILVWDSSWEDPFVTRMKGPDNWPAVRYTHWMPLPDAPTPQSERE